MNTANFVNPISACMMYYLGAASVAGLRVKMLKISIREWKALQQELPFWAVKSGYFGSVPLRFVRKDVWTS